MSDEMRRRILELFDVTEEELADDHGWADARKAANEQYAWFRDVVIPQRMAEIQRLVEDAGPSPFQ